MKKLLIMLLTLVLGQGMAIAEQPGGSTPTPFEKGKGGAIRPHAPSRQVITGTYVDGILVISFAIPEGMCELCVSDSFSGMQSYYNVDSSDSYCEVYIGDYSPFSVDLTTEGGVSYTAIF